MKGLKNLKIIKEPRITEKSTNLAAFNVYVFDVQKEANKTEIKKAVFALYKVKPVKVNLLAIPKKKILARGKEGIRGGGKKAVVYLKKEDKIEIL